LKHKAWIKYKRSLLPSDHSIYVRYRNDCTAAVRRAKYDFENNLVNGIKVFRSVFTQENAMDVSLFGAWHLESSLSAISITAEDVWKQLCGLKAHKSSGPDNCHPRVLLELKEGLVQPLF